MNLNDLANIAQIIAAAGVVISLVYLAVQIRGNTKVAGAQARHTLSEFALPVCNISRGARRSICQAGTTH